MYKYYCYLLLLLLCPFSRLQAEEPSGLQQLYERANRSGRASDYWALCQYLLDYGDGQGLFPEALEQGRRAASAEGLPDSLALYYDYQAEYYLANGELERYMPAKRKAYALYQAAGNRDKQAECCIYIGNYFNAVTRYDSARFYLERMDDYARAHPAETSYNIMLSCLSDTYYRMGLIDSALHKETLSVRYSVQLKDTMTLLGSYRALGMYCRTLGRLEEAFRHNESGLALLVGRDGAQFAEEKASLYTNLAVLCRDMKQPQEALRYAHEVYRLLPDVSNELGSVQIYANISTVFLEGNEFGLAADCIRRSSALARKMGDANMLLRNLGYAVRMKSLQGEPDSVNYYIREAHTLLPEVQTPTTLLGYYQAEQEALMAQGCYEAALASGRAILKIGSTGQRKFVLLELYKAMQLCHSRLGHYREALEYADRYISLNDSLQSLDKDKALQELNVKYETKEKELKIARIESERRIAAERNKNRVMLLLLALALLAFVSLFLIYRQRKRAERLQRYAREKEQQLTLLQYDTELRLTRQYLDGLETERNRLAKELHDGISNDLYVLEMKFRQASAPTAALAASLQEIRESVRSISHELMPPSFSELTLREILQDYTDNLREAAGNVDITFCADPVDADWAGIPQSTAILLYRTAQEALANTLKHASATSVYVELELSGRELILYVKDNGCGQAAGTSHTGIGLSTMQERVASLHGTLTVESRVGEGTLVKCVLPLDAAPAPSLFTSEEKES